MNPLERFVYNLVKDNPVLKMKLVRTYQNLLGLVPQVAIRSHLPVVVREGYFFGFHDKSPFSPDNTRLLAHRDLIGTRRVRPGDAAGIGYFQGANWTDFTSLGITRAWDWQLGAMLQWRGQSSTELVFNDIVDGVVGCRIVGIDGAERASYRHGVVHVSPDGRWASSYCFRRVSKAMPGYGARMPGDELQPLHGFQCSEPADFRVFSLKDGSTRFSLDFAKIRTVNPHPSMEGAFHYFHHSLFNPSGTRLFFLHRWLDGNERRWTRMFSCSANGDDLFLFPTSGMVSHIGWLDDSRVLAYARTAEQGDGYYIFTDGESTWERVAELDFDSDGHPMYSPQGDVFVTDTYPDRFRNQRLFLYSLSRKQRTELLRTHLGSKFLYDLQVDLHPRFDRSGGVVCVDSGHTGTRSLCTLRLDGLREAA